MTKENLIEEYKYYYESYIYYDYVKKEKSFAEVNLAKCNLLADLIIRYFQGDLQELMDISQVINEAIKNKHQVTIGEGENHE